MVFKPDKKKVVITLILAGVASALAFCLLLIYRNLSLSLVNFISVVLFSTFVVSVMGIYFARVSKAVEIEFEFISIGIGYKKIKLLKSEIQEIVYTGNEQLRILHSGGVCMIDLNYMQNKQSLLEGVKKHYNSKINRDNYLWDKITNWL